MKKNEFLTLFLPYSGSPKNSQKQTMHVFYCSNRIFKKLKFPSKERRLFHQFSIFCAPKPQKKCFFGKIGIRSRVVIFFQLAWRAGTRYKWKKWVFHPIFTLFLESRKHIKTEDTRVLQLYLHFYKVEKNGFEVTFGSPVFNTLCK